MKLSVHQTRRLQKHTEQDHKASSQNKRLDLNSIDFRWEEMKEDTDMKLIRSTEYNIYL